MTWVGRPMTDAVTAAARYAAAAAACWQASGVGSACGSTALSATLSTCCRRRQRQSPGTPVQPHGLVRVGAAPGGVARQRGIRGWPQVRAAAAGRPLPPPTPPPARRLPPVRRLCRDGRRSGRAEGKALGLQKGFEVGHEVGYYAGCCRLWRQLQAHDPQLLRCGGGGAGASGAGCLVARACMHVCLQRWSAIRPKADPIQQRSSRAPINRVLPLPSLAAASA